MSILTAREHPAEDAEYPTYLDVLAERLRRAEAAVQSEYEENDRRLNWFLLFHAFLFGAYATCLQALTGAQDTRIDDSSFVRLFLSVLGVVAVVSSLCTGIATVAAIEAIVRTKQTRATLEGEAQTHGFEATPFSAGSGLHHLGLLPTYVAPWLLLIAWVAIFCVALDRGISTFF